MGTLILRHGVELLLYFCSLVVILTLSFFAVYLKGTITLGKNRNRRRTNTSETEYLTSWRTNRTSHRTLSQLPWTLD